MAVSEEQKEQNNKKASNLIFFLGICCAIAFIIFTKCIRIVIVTGSSMEPTYKSGKLLITSPFFTDDDLVNGTVVVFSDNGRTKGIAKDGLLIKRIEGVPGDVLQVKDGQLYRNNQAVKEPYGKTIPAGILNKPYIVQDNEYFCLGDNREYSEDSRYFGAVERNDIKYILKEGN